MTIISNNCYKSWIERDLSDGFISFFTPTYNREALLPRVYSSLNNQTNKHFVWILVNDGSTDNTDKKAKELLEREEFPIIYISKDNGHKHSCFKVALQNCRTELFVCMDDDDVYSEQSVEFFLKEWAIIKNEGRKDVGAIRTLTQREDGSYVSNVSVLPSEMGEKEDISTLERNYILNIHQENWTCYDTQKLKEIDLFPQNYWLQDKHRYFAEVIWQGRFARKYKCRYINIALRKYMEDAPTSIMRDGKGKQHYLDLFINRVIINNEQFDYIEKSTTHLLHVVILVNVLRGYLGYSLKELLHNTTVTLLKCLYVLTLPFSFVGKPIINFKRK